MRARMDAVRAALRRAGIADRDIQTSTISLQPDYRYAENQPPELTGYRAINQVSVRFRDIASTGRILDAWSPQGANQINGPMLEHRPAGGGAGRGAHRGASRPPARAPSSMRARSACGSPGARGQRDRRAVDADAAADGDGRAQSADVATAKIDPGEQRLSRCLTVSFELR